MYSHILISTDGSELAGKGLDHGLSLARALGSKVTIVTVTEPFPIFADAAGGGWSPGLVAPEGYEEDQKAYADGILAAAGSAADTAGVLASVLHVAKSHPAEAIVETARSQGCELIVMASHGRRGLGRLVLGSQTSEVVASSPVPVLVVR
jgi:nucleotide-binding universal stress UspA family protein